MRHAYKPKWRLIRVRDFRARPADRPAADRFKPVHHGANQGGGDSKLWRGKDGCTRVQEGETDAGKEEGHEENQEGKIALPAI